MKKIFYLIAVLLTVISCSNDSDYLTDVLIAGVDIDDRFSAAPPVVNERPEYELIYITWEKGNDVIPDDVEVYVQYSPDNNKTWYYYSPGDKKLVENPVRLKPEKKVDSYYGYVTYELCVRREYFPYLGPNNNYDVRLRYADIPGTGFLGSYWSDNFRMYDNHYGFTIGEENTFPVRIHVTSTANYDYYTGSISIEGTDRLYESEKLSIGTTTFQIPDEFLGKQCYLYIHIEAEWLFNGKKATAGHGQYITLNKQELPVYSYNFTNSDFYNGAVR